MSITIRSAAAASMLRNMIGSARDKATTDGVQTLPDDVLLVELTVEYADALASHLEALDPLNILPTMASQIAALHELSRDGGQLMAQVGRVQDMCGGLSVEIGQLRSSIPVPLLARLRRWWHELRSPIPVRVSQDLRRVVADDADRMALIAAFERREDSASLRALAASLSTFVTREAAQEALERVEAIQEARTFELMAPVSDEYDDDDESRAITGPHDDPEGFGMKCVDPDDDYCYWCGYSRTDGQHAPDCEWETRRQRKEAAAE